LRKGGMTMKTIPPQQRIRIPDTHMLIFAFSHTGRDCFCLEEEHGLKRRDLCCQQSCFVVLDRQERGHLFRSREPDMDPHEHT
jgi:hypothetical protein